MSKVNVFNEDGDVIAIVEYNTNLDIYDGRNYSNGGTGRHLGITKLADGNFVLIEGSDWQGDTNIGYIISDERAFQEILKSRSYELLEEDKFKGLKVFCEKLIEEV